MCLTEFDQDKYDEMIRRESREEGIEQGVKRTKLIFRMERDGKTISEIAEVAGISEQEVREILED
jgi:predicted transposase YdaD